MDWVEERDEVDVVLGGLILCVCADSSPVYTNVVDAGEEVVEELTHIFSLSVSVLNA